MKKKQLFILAFLLVLAAILLPEVQHLLSLDLNDTTTILAAGPAFAPLKWNMGKNNMAGYKGHLLFVPEEAAITVPTVPDPEKAADNTELITAAGSFTFAEGSIKQPVYLYSTEGEVEYKASHRRSRRYQL